MNKPQTKLLLVYALISVACIQEMYAMDKQSLYSLREVTELSSAPKNESAHLLSHDFMAKDAATFHTNPPSYQELYISEEESATEYKRLTDLLATKERDLERLPTSLSHNLSFLARKRKVESCNSNILVSSLAGAYYVITTFVYAGANNYPPAEDKMKVMLYCFNGLGSTVASGFYAVLNAGEKEN